MSFQLVPNSVTLDDLERRDSANRCVISPNSVAFGTDTIWKYLCMYMYLDQANALFFVFRSTYTALL